MVSSEGAPDLARVRREGSPIAGEAQRQTATTRYQRDGALQEGSRCLDRLASLAPSGSQIPTADEKRDWGVGSYGGVGRELSPTCLCPGVMPREPSNDVDGGRRCDSLPYHRVSRIQQHVRYRIPMIARLPAGKAPRTCPRWGGMRVVERHVSVRDHPGEAHLSPWRDGLTRLSIRDRAGASAKLRAKYALLERRAARLEDRQDAHGAQTGTRHSLRD
jgi:hypothetical protein